MVSFKSKLISLEVVCAKMVESAEICLVKINKRVLTSLFLTVGSSRFVFIVASWGVTENSRSNTESWILKCSNHVVKVDYGYEIVSDKTGA